MFQAEIFAILKAAKIVNSRKIPKQKITIYVDSQAAIKVLAKKTVSSKVVSDCRKALKKMADQHSVLICWVPGHSGVDGNEKADELARAGSSMNENRADASIKIPLQSVMTSFDAATLNMTNRTWTTMDNCVISRKLWPRLNKKNTSYILRLDRSSVATLVGVLTGHCVIGIMANRLRVPTNDFCRSCRDEEEPESVRHLLCECPALQRRRLATLGRRFFEEMEEIGRLDPRCILDFVKRSGWFQS